MDLGAHPFVSEPWTGVSRLLQKGPSIPELSETTMPVNFKLFDEIRKRSRKPLETFTLPALTVSVFTILDFFLGNTIQARIIAATLSDHVGKKLRECGLS
jgi:hypothetical protein